VVKRGQKTVAFVVGERGTGVWGLFSGVPGGRVFEWGSRA
jgi:hypothetical protein